MQKVDMIQSEFNLAQRVIRFAKYFLGSLQKD